VSPVSEWVGQWERTYGVPAARIQVVYPGVDGEVFRPMPFPRSSRPTVVSFSPIAPAEDLETMLEVADRVRRAVPDVVFLHHGPVADGGYWERIRALTRERLLEDTVRFLGPTERVATAFNCADVTLSTSTGEGFPPTVIESLACGTPVVATAVGGIREALDGPGVTAPPGDTERLAEAVVAILRLPAGQRERLKEAARSTAVQKFALSTFADRYWATYRQLAGLPAEPVVDLVAEPVVDLVAEPVAPLGEPIVVPDIAWNSQGMPALVSVAAFDRPAAPMPRPGSPKRVAPPVSPRTPPLWEVALPEPTRPARTVPAHIRMAILEDDAPVRVGALSRATDRPDAVDVIASALADDAPQVRREAVRALMRIGGSVAGRALSDALAHDPSSEVRREAVSALAALLARRAGGFESGGA
jgi:hypothetical protein